MLDAYPAPFFFCSSCFRQTMQTTKSIRKPNYMLRVGLRCQYATCKASVTLYVTGKRHNVRSKMSEFLPLRKKLKRVGTGEEENFVPSYLPETLAAASASRAREDIEKVEYIYIHVHKQCISTNSACAEGTWHASLSREQYMYPEEVSLVPRPHLRERGSGDIRLIPRASLTFITFWREISLHQSHCRKDNL